MLPVLPVPLVLLVLPVLPVGSDDPVYCRWRRRTCCAGDRAGQRIEEADGVTQGTTAGGHVEARAEALAGYQRSGPGHLNCAQAVVHFAMRALGRDTGLVTAGAYMGGGMVRLGHVCGALSGAALALGLRDLTDPEGAERDAAVVTAELQALMRDFEAEFGDTACRGLTGHDISTREGYRAFAAGDARARCAGYVGWVCDRLGAIV